MKYFVRIATIVMCMYASMHAQDDLRVWTRIDGVKVEGILHEVTENKLILIIKGKKYSFAKDIFSGDDQHYLEKRKIKLEKYDIVSYKVKPTHLQKKFIEEHKLISLSLKIKGRNRQMPFMINITEPSKKIPLIVYLHGTGGIGNDNLSPIFKDAGGVAQVLYSKKFQKFKQCYVVIPQAHEISAWYNPDPNEPSQALSNVVGILDALKKKGYMIDSQRIYIIGVSMGGAGAYQAMAKMPDVFAAAIPIAYVESPILLTKKNVGNMWVVVNRGDATLNMNTLNTFKKQYSKLGGKLKVTINDKKGHNAWDSILLNKKFSNWLFHRKK